MTEEARGFILRQMTLMGDERLDPEVFGRSASFASVLRNHECMMAHPDEGSPEAIAYWRERGLNKELHGADTGRKYDKWAGYLPTDLAPGERRPLLFIMHGAGNPIYLAECYGYVGIAARERLIAIIPEDETPESVEGLMEYAREHYPVDRSRVYMVGYSLGGYMTARHAFRWPECLAAVGPGGMLFANGHAVPQTQGGKVWPGEDITPEMVIRAAGFGVPACLSMGEYEVLGLLPVTRDEPRNQWVEHLDEEARARMDREAAQAPASSDRIDLSGRNKIASLNNWRIINGCGPIPEEKVRQAVRDTADIVVEKIGFPFERTRVETREDRSFYIGDCLTPEGENTLRVIGVAKAPHWISQAQAELTWEFISQFALDTVTGRSYRRTCKEANPPDDGLSGRSQVCLDQ